MSIDYEHIVEGCKRRDPKAQRQLYDGTVGMAMGICMRYASCRSEAQDLLQDGYVKVYEHIGSLRQPERLFSWIYTVMVNTCIEATRRSSFERLANDMEPHVQPFDFDPYTQHDVVAAMQQLDPRQRLAFNLFAIEGYSVDEVARRMKISGGNVRVILNRARNKMKEYLTH